MGKIIDLSHHQEPKNIDYDKMAKELDLAIIRTQYGSATLDRHYKTHHAELRKRGVPTHAYAWVRGVSLSDMEKEATDFYNRTKDLNPEVWWLDVEEISMADMRNGVSAYVKKLRQLGARKVGAYIAHHLYKQLNLKVEEFDAVWIPRYGNNNGQQQQKPAYPCDLWQYTSTGRIAGYSGDVDLNVLTGSKGLDWFVGCQEVTATLNSKVIKAIMVNGSTHLSKIVLDMLNIKGDGIPVVNYQGEKFYQWNRIPGMKEPVQRKDGGFDFVATAQPKPKPETPKDIIDKMVEHGVIKTPEYWKTLRNGKVAFNWEWLEELFKNVDKKLEGK